MPAITRTARFCALVMLTLGVALASTLLMSSSADAAPTAERQRRAVGSRVLTAEHIAMNQRGDSYAYGAAGPNAFDCSGLVFYSYRRAGFAVPRTSSAQAAHTRRIAKQNMRTGDLMFFASGGGVYHAAIFLRWQHGHALMLHAPGSGRRVTVAPAWTSSWFGGTLRR